MNKKILIIISGMLIIAGLWAYLRHSNSGGNKEDLKKNVSVDKSVVLGVWVTVFSKEKVLYSKVAAHQLVQFCKKNNIAEIYVQIFRGGEPFYDSATLKKREYLNMFKAMDSDPLDYLLAQAHQHGIKVHAWVNVLSLAQNKSAPILQEYGQSVLTRDKNLRASIRNQDTNESDKFYLRDDQLFLEPGDDRVVRFTLNVVDEIIARYPLMDGIHLDYVRYPYPVPFIPDSRFIENGVSYGFGQENLNRFEKTHGRNPRKDDMFDNGLYLTWDNWKREQVTHLVKSISDLVRAKAPRWKISCAVIPAFEKAYSVAYQDWGPWLTQGIVDYVVLMNYTRDSRLLYESSRAALTTNDQGKIYLGLGAFLFKDRAEFESNYRLAKELTLSGIVFFSYDELLALYEKDDTIISK